MTNSTGTTRILTGMMTSNKKDSTETIVHADATATVHVTIKDKEDAAVSISLDAANIHQKNGSRP